MNHQIKGKQERKFSWLPRKVGGKWTWFTFYQLETYELENFFTDKIFKVKRKVK